MIISHPDNETQIIDLGPGPGEDRPGSTIVPAHAAVELLGRFGPHVALNIYVMPINWIDYVEPGQRLTLVRALLYPLSEPDDSPMRYCTWGGGPPSCEDLQHRPLLGVGVGILLLSTRAMLTGSSIGIVVRNNTNEPIPTKVQVTYTSLGGWCEATSPDDVAKVMTVTNATIEALRWKKMDKLDN